MVQQSGGCSEVLLRHGSYFPTNPEGKRKSNHVFDGDCGGKVYMHTLMYAGNALLKCVCESERERKIFRCVRHASYPVSAVVSESGSAQRI